MAIDKSGQWWQGTAPRDLDEYLAWHTEGGYAVSRVVHATCGACGCTEFSVLVDDEAGCAERRCMSCGERFLLLDSADTAEEAQLDDAACPCGGESFNVAVGFAHTADGAIRWVYVALRCTSDGVLGVYTDWKIDYSPAAGLYDRV